MNRNNPIGLAVFVIVLGVLPTNSTAQSLFPESIVGLALSPELMGLHGPLNGRENGSGSRTTVSTIVETGRLGPSGEPWISTDNLALVGTFASESSELSVGAVAGRIESSEQRIREGGALLVSFRDERFGSRGWLEADGERVEYRARMFVPAIKPVELGIWATRDVVDGIPFSVVQQQLDLASIVLQSAVPAIGLNGSIGRIRVGLGTANAELGTTTASDRTDRGLSTSMTTDRTLMLRGSGRIVLRDLILDLEFQRMTGSAHAYVVNDETAAPVTLIEFLGFNYTNVKGGIAWGPYFRTFGFFHKVECDDATGMIDVGEVSPLFGLILGRHYQVTGADVLGIERGFGVSGSVSLGQVGLGGQIALSEYDVSGTLRLSHEEGWLFPRTVEEDHGIGARTETAISAGCYVELPIGAWITLRGTALGIVPFEPEFFQDRTPSEAFQELTEQAKEWRAARATITAVVRLPSLF